MLKDFVQPTGRVSRAVPLVPKENNDLRNQRRQELIQAYAKRQAERRKTYAN